MARTDDPDESEQNVYGNQARETLMDDGEISPEEDAFMQGYDQPEEESDESASDAYEGAFETKQPKRKRSKRDDLDVEEEEE